jgi:hypothetical protein
VLLNSTQDPSKIQRPQVSFRAFKALDRTHRLDVVVFLSETKVNRSRVKALNKRLNFGNFYVLKLRVEFVGTSKP